MEAINISDARRRLPELAKRVARTPGAAVIIEHRDLGERLVLTTEGRMRYLETLVEQLRAERTRRAGVAGTASTELDADALGDALDALRRSGSEEAAARLADLAG